MKSAFRFIAKGYCTPALFSMNTKEVLQKFFLPIHSEGLFSVTLTSIGKLRAV